jgi:hypothetical protein
MVEREGLDPFAYLVDWTAVGCEPATTGLGPVGAVGKLFARTKQGLGRRAPIGRATRQKAPSGSRAPTAVFS